jgi:hypothetical protein
MVEFHQSGGRSPGSPDTLGVAFPGIEAEHAARAGDRQRWPDIKIAR